MVRLVATHSIRPPGCGERIPMQPHTPPNNPTRSASLRDQIVGIEREVPLLDGSMRRYINFDNAASTPALRPVQDKLNELLEWYASVHRGTGFKSMVSTEAYEDARRIVAAFVGADSETSAVIFGKNTTEAVNKLAARFGLQPGDVVITTQFEHHSNDLPWRPRAEVVYAELNPDGSLDVVDLHRKIEQYAGRLRLVAVSGASNVTGFMPPIHQIAEWAHAAGALIFVDAAQLAPHRAIDVGEPGTPGYIDFLALSAHKMYAPFGTGALIGSKDFFRRGEPDYRGGGTVEIVTLGDVEWSDPPERDEAGSPNVLGAVALAASIRVLEQVGMGAVAAHEKHLMRYALNKLGALDGVTLYGSPDPDRLDDRVGVIPFNVEGMPHPKVAAILGYEGGIGVRNGCFCAHPYILRLLGVSDEDAQQVRAAMHARDRSSVPGLVRASFGCYNTTDEIDTFVEMLGRILDGDYKGDYVLDRPTGDYTPRGFDPAILRQHFEL